ncbi:hypothetical protein SESBI_17922 [Sesbania bispinosa]|nr:hypothetical protein SESBI_17922 [Sesbania bispinosa]
MEEGNNVLYNTLEKVQSKITEDIFDAPAWAAKTGRSRKINQMLLEEEDLSNLTETGMLKLPSSLFDSYGCCTLLEGVSAMLPK